LVSNKNGRLVPSLSWRRGSCVALGRAGQGRDGRGGRRGRGGGAQAARADRGRARAEARRDGAAGDGREGGIQHSPPIIQHSTPNAHHSTLPHPTPNTHHPTLTHKDYGGGEGAPLSPEEVEVVLASIADANNYVSPVTWSGVEWSGVSTLTLPSPLPHPSSRRT
jgi:hypothetical protein